MRGLSRLKGPLLLLGTLLGAALILRIWPVELGGLGAVAREQGPAMFVLYAALGCALGLPRQVACFAAGAAFGTASGVGLALAAELLGCVADVVWARLVARDWVRRRFGTRLSRLDRLITRRPFSATLSLRLMPVGNNLLLNLAAGLSSVGLAPFVLASAIGYLPQTLVFVLIGAGAMVGTGLQLALGVVLFMLSVGLGLVVLRAARGDRREKVAEA